MQSKNILTLITELQSDLNTSHQKFPSYFSFQHRHEHRNIDDDHYQWRRYIVKNHKYQPVRTTSSSPNDTRAPRPEKFGLMDTNRFVTPVTHYLCTFSLETDLTEDQHSTGQLGQLWRIKAFECS